LVAVLKQQRDGAQQVGTDGFCRKHGNEKRGLKREEKRSVKTKGVAERDLYPWDQSKNEN